MKRSVRVRPAQMLARYGSEFQRVQTHLEVQARCGRRWMNVAVVEVEAEDFDEQLAQAISDAEHKAAAVRPWTNGGRRD